MLMIGRQQSKLTASRYLRVRKLVLHVCTPHSRFPLAHTVHQVHEKMEKLLPDTNTRPRASAEGQEQQSPPPSPPKPRAEDMYEILCNDLVLPYDMTLAAIRQFVWKQSSELVMHYRRKQPTGQAQGQLRVGT